MNISTTIVVVGFAALSILNIATAVLIQRMLRSPRTRLLEDDEAPLGLVILCLRGGDPFLDRSLRRLIDQDYPNYRVRIMLDSENDSARPYVDAVLNELRPRNVEVSWLRERYDTCTYKMSGILAATASLPEGTRFVALMDGDTVPHRSWLRELASPIVRGEALCTTGNRWYFPEQADLGSMVRVAWGAGALIMMSLTRIPWGGTMAVRSDVIGDERLRHRIQHAFSEDTTIAQFINELGGRIEVEPRLVIVNYEQIRMRSFFNFNTRQLLAARLQHRSWWWIVLHGVSGLPMIGFPIARMLGLDLGPAADVA
ncbi:MAG: glycosyltransferase family 2 protein, partial [Planctomycetaceae bacterium]|nr:glycosyltransferase family 2 protein [Planctomycetaceae bacterium]